MFSKIHLRPHKQIASIAFPMFLANISQPLLALVDTAIVGHMPHVDFLAGVALGSLLISQLYWLLGAMRMSATGISARLKGAGSSQNSEPLVQLLFLALLACCLLLLLSSPLPWTVMLLTEPTAQAAESFTQYFNTRLWGSPAALVNLVLIGWLIGQQRARLVMFLQVAGNLLNLLLSLVFVYVFDLSVMGVALATVFSEWFMCIGALWAILRLPLHWQFSVSGFRFQRLRTVLSTNSAMFVRNLALQACLAFITLQGARYGELSVAMNSILLQFMALTALGLDAVAYAAEALCGHAVGARENKKLRSAVINTLAWSLILAVIYSVVFYVFGDQIVALLTDLPSIRLLSQEYVLIACLIPLVAHWCFLFDGVYVGLGRANVMRNSMLVSAGVGFFLGYWLFNHYENKALWIAFLIFLAFRGVSLMGHFYLKVLGQK